MKNQAFFKQPEDSAELAEGQNAVEVHNLYKSFGPQMVLNGIDLHVRRGETLVILGRSGAGKSILLKLLIGLQRADSGSIRILNQEITQLESAKLNSIRKRMGFSFQYSALFDSLTVEQNVAFPLEHHTHLLKAQIKEKAVELLETVGMVESLSKLPAELSGGMRKRVGIARALALDPKLMLFDEPTAGLDPITARGINDLIQQLGGQRSITSVVVTHDLRSAEHIADRVILLNEGRIQFAGTFKDLGYSRDPLVVEFLASS